MLGEGQFETVFPELPETTETVKTFEELTRGKDVSNLDAFIAEITKANVTTPDKVKEDACKDFDNFWLIFEKWKKRKPAVPKEAKKKEPEEKKEEPPEIDESAKPAQPEKYESHKPKPQSEKKIDPKDEIDCPPKSGKMNKKVSVAVGYCNNTCEEKGSCITFQGYLKRKTGEPLSGECPNTQEQYIQSYCRENCKSFSGCPAWS